MGEDGLYQRFHSAQEKLMEHVRCYLLIDIASRKGPEEILWKKSDHDGGNETGFWEESEQMLTSCAWNEFSVSSFSMDFLGPWSARMVSTC